MNLRANLLFAVLAASAFCAISAREGAAWSAAEGWFLDFLVANARDRFERAELKPADNMVFVEFHEKDKAEYTAWPPAPIDYIIVLKKLKNHDPSAVAFSDVLKWKKSDMQFVDELQQALVGLNQVVLAYSAATGATLESGLVGEEKSVPSIPMVEGDSSAAPRLSRLNFPEPRLSTQMQLGFVATHVEQPAKVPALLVARADERLVPSLAAQMISLHWHAPYVSQRLRFGAGAGLYLGTEHFIPLAQDGTAQPRLMGDITRVNALELYTPDLGDATSKAASEKLGRNKLIVLGTSPSPGEIHAKLAAWALALPPLKLAPDWVNWMLAIAAALVVIVWVSGFGRWGAAVSGAFAVMALLGVAVVMFQSSLIWWPPLLPGIILVAGTIFSVIWPQND